MDNLHKPHKKLVLVLDGLSGVGKDTITNKIVEMYPDVFEKTISVTTREMRPSERQGYPYFFVDNSTFKQMIETGEVFEHTIRHDSYRGMRKSCFDRLFAQNKIPVKDCDHLGLDAISKTFGDVTISFFLTAPKDVIKQRLLERGEAPDSAQRRLEYNDNYITTAKYYDYVIENIDMNETISQILNLINEKLAE